MPENNDHELYTVELVSVHNRVSEIEATLAFSLDGALDDLYDETKPHFTAIRQAMRVRYQELKDKRQAAETPPRPRVSFYNENADPFASFDAGEMYATLAQAAELGALGFVIDAGDGGDTADRYYLRHPGADAADFKSVPAEEFFAWSAGHVEHSAMGGLAPEGDDEAEKAKRIDEKADDLAGFLARRHGLGKGGEHG